jgi:hypothetical protein
MVRDVRNQRPFPLMWLNFQQGRLDTMLEVYLGRPKLESLRSLLEQDHDSPGYDPAGQLMLLSPQKFAHFANGRLSLVADPLEATSDSVSLVMK